MQTHRDGGSGQLLQQFKTKRKTDTRDPTWNETFVLQPAVPLSQLTLRLTVWDHDLDGIGNDWWGHVELSLSDMTLLQGSTQVMELQSRFGKTGQVTKAAEGSISFSLKAERHDRGDKPRDTVRSRLRSFVAFVARGWTRKLAAHGNQNAF